MLVEGNGLDGEYGGVGGDDDDDYGVNHNHT